MGARQRGRSFGSALEWELMEARGASNHGISITSRPNEKLVMWERKSLLEREADVYLQCAGVRGLRTGRERRHDRTRGSSILSDEAKAQIISAHQSGETQTALADRFNVSRRLIFNIVKGRSRGSS